MATKYTRVTLLGSERHADTLLPATTPVGALMPQVLTLLAEKPGQSPSVRALYRDDGAQIAPDATLEQVGVLDGESLTVAATTSAPASPVVYDLHDAVAGQTEVSGRWSRLARLAVLGLVATVLGWWTGTGLTTGLNPDESAQIRLGVGVVLALASLAVSLKTPHRAVALTLLACGAAMLLDGHWNLMSLRGVALGPAVLLGLCGGVVLLLLLGAVSGLRRPLTLAAGVLAALTAAWAASPWLSAWLIGDRQADTQVTVGALSGLAATLLLAVIAQAAVAQSGLAGLDDHEAGGDRLLRTDVRAAIAAAHRAMILGTLLCCVSLAVSFWWISQDTYHPPFSLSFCAVLVLAVWLRARTFPLTLQRAPLLLVSAWGLWCTMRLTVGLWPESRFPVLIGLAVLAVWLVLLQTVRIPEHVQARWRRLGHVVETLAVVALIPLLIGYVGLYGAMLEAF